MTFTRHEWQRVILALEMRANFLDGDGSTSGEARSAKAWRQLAAKARDQYRMQREYANRRASMLRDNRKSRRARK